jgi:hypothetical protein
MKLISVKKSTAKGKKFMALFDKNGEKKLVHFGALGYLDYTSGATDKQRTAYLARHDKEKNQAADTAGALSYHILWGQSRSRTKNIESFKKKYNL